MTFKISVPREDICFIVIETNEPVYSLKECTHYLLGHEVSSR